MTAKKVGWGGITLSVAGLILLIVGILWLTIIFPMLAKLPTDYERSYYFEGTFWVANSSTGGMDVFPIEQTLAHKAAGTQGNILFIDEKWTVTRTDTSPPTDISAVFGEESTLAVDRSTLKYVPDVDEQGRLGYWGPPRGLGEGDSFDVWNRGAHQALIAYYVTTQEFRGLQVVIFKIMENDLPLGNHPQTQLPLFMGTTIYLTIEPKSGTVVEQNALSTTSMEMASGKVPVQIANVKWTEQTISELVDVAKDAVKMLFWFETVVPWLLIGIGAIILIVGVAAIARGRTKSA
ncbi:MAG: DUF3068 domain-containing protein [Chloroflexi bacterium]|nr:DUF3068 domain-containing protein [Chloroflexota bacterium]